MQIDQKPTFADWQAFYDSLRAAGATEAEIAAAMTARDESGLGCLAMPIGNGGACGL